MLARVPSSPHTLDQVEGNTSLDLLPLGEVERGAEGRGVGLPVGPHWTQQGRDSAVNILKCQSLSCV